MDNCPSYWESTVGAYAPGNEDKKGLSFVNFIPDLLNPNRGVFSGPKYEKFGALVDRANAWLQTNPQWELKTCESVEFKTMSAHVDPEEMIYLEYGECRNRYIRGLRLWLQKRTGDSFQIQQIGYVNVIPAVTRYGGVFSTNQHETLDSVIARFNSKILMHPLPGKIITIETQEMKTYGFGDLDPDKSCWIETGDITNTFLFILRIFYDLTHQETAEIGVQNFVPEMLEEASCCTKPTFESFSDILKRASDWCATNQSIRICNTQSVVLKMKHGYEIDPQRVHYTVHGSRVTYYIKVIRVAYTRPAVDAVPRPPMSSRLTCRTFIPKCVGRSMCDYEYQSLSETMMMVDAWVRATGATVVSCETTAMRRELVSKYGAEKLMTYNLTESSEYWIFVIRVYLDGVYPEPSPDLLPPVPEEASDICCCLS